MELPAELTALASLLVSLAATILALVYVFARRRRRTDQASRREAGRPARDWHVETGDPLAGLRSPYKTAPLCRRCLAVGHAGDTAYFMCRMNDQCELYEDERAT
jgi:hypothetical protein